MDIGTEEDGFLGPVAKISDLPQKPGVYLVLSQCENEQDFRALDVGESQDIRDRISRHNRADCWREHAAGRQIYYYYCLCRGENERMDLEYKLRRLYNPSCGER